MRIDNLNKESATRNVSSARTNNSQADGVNLLLDTANMNSWLGGATGRVKQGEKSPLGTNVWEFYEQYGGIDLYDYVSFGAQTETTTYKFSGYMCSPLGIKQQLMFFPRRNDGVDWENTPVVICTSTEWEHFEAELRFPAVTNTDKNPALLALNYINKPGNQNVLQLANLKLERGDRATIWTPAPQDKHLDGGGWVNMPTIVAYDNNGKRCLVHPYHYRNDKWTFINIAPYLPNGKRASRLVWGQGSSTHVRTWNEMKNNPDSQYQFIGKEIKKPSEYATDWYAWVSKDKKTLRCTVEKPDESDCLEGKISKNSVKGLKEYFLLPGVLSNITTVQSDRIVAETRINYMFYGCRSLTNLDGLANWDTSKVTNMYSVFQNCNSLTNLDGLSNWDTSNVTDMRFMVSDSDHLTNLDGLANWDTSNVTDMSNMFYDCDSLTNIDGLASWNTSNVTDMNSMFEWCKSLTNVDALAGWNVSNVTNMHNMFRGVPDSVERPAWYIKDKD